MCGITGALNISDKTKDLSQLTELMAEKMAHRGPDAFGYFNTEKISLGHRRLSIIDLNEVANQPITDVSGRYTIIFNGEMYNFKEVKQKLDYPFISEGDTEVILAAYIKWGSDCLAHFNGMFSLAIWDNEKSELFLARDRMAVKPLFYFQNSEIFLFASEITALLSTDIIPKIVSAEGLVDYLSYQSVHAPNTIIKNVFQLNGGEFALISEGKLNIHTYWHMLAPTQNYEIDSYESAKLNVLVKLKESIDLRMVSDVPLGVFLSGGIDSGVITALMSEVSETPIKTITVGFNEKKFDESEIAQITANKFKTDHTNYILEPNEFLNLLPQIIKSFYSPSSDGPNTFMVSMVAKKLGITVVQSGLGGDELFAGYPLFKQIKALSKNKWLWYIPKFIRNYALGLGKTKRLKNKIEQLFESENSISNMYAIFRRVMSKKTMSRLLSNQILPAVNYDWVKNELNSKKTDLNKLPLLSQISYAEMVSYTQSVLLKDSDQMSMANSIELREPFFDYKLVELLLQIPDEFKPMNKPKKLLVDSLNNLLPEILTVNKKKTFTFPWESWLKNELKDFCETNIAHLYNYNNLFNTNELKLFWQKYLESDDEILWTEIWGLVVLGSWLKQNNIETN
jgi:asparagine synthase (glutamine-hydrolysing)